MSPSRCPFRTRQPAQQQDNEPSGRAASPVLFFFFQAEDGIRDWSVTGVQTCALPIYRRRGAHRQVRSRARRHAVPYEIGDLSLTAQAKILRVLQERQLEHVGGRKTIAVEDRKSVV